MSIDSPDQIVDRVAAHADRSYTVMRLGLGATMTLIGVHKIIDPAVWASYIAPIFYTLLNAVGISGKLFMQITAIGEIGLGLLLLANVMPTVIAGMLSLFMLSIIINIALGGTSLSILLRDVGIFVLASATMLRAAGEEHDNTDG